MPPAKKKPFVAVAEPLFIPREGLPIITALSDNTIDALMRAGDFPKPRQTSGRRVAWLLRELREWAESRPVSDLPPPPNTGGRKGQVSDQYMVNGDASNPWELRGPQRWYWDRTGAAHPRNDLKCPGLDHPPPLASSNSARVAGFSLAMGGGGSSSCLGVDRRGSNRGAMVSESKKANPCRLA